jgi:hypothetical protein
LLGLCAAPLILSGTVLAQTAGTSTAIKKQEGHSATEMQAPSQKQEGRSATEMQAPSGGGAPGVEAKPGVQSGDVPKSDMPKGDMPKSNMNPNDKYQ